MSTLSKPEHSHTEPTDQLVHACDSPDSTVAKCGADVSDRSVKPRGTPIGCTVCSYLVAGWPE